MGVPDDAAWTEPLADGSVAGPNLELAPEFGALERAAQGKPEQQYGDTIIAAADPDWKEVEEQALALLDRTRDLRVPHESRCGASASRRVCRLRRDAGIDPATPDGGLAGGPSAARP